MNTINYITRSVSIRIIECTAVDLTDKSIHTVTVEIPNRNYKEKAKEKAVQALLPENYRLIAIESETYKKELRGMPVSDFLKASKVIETVDTAAKEE